MLIVATTISAPFSSHAFDLLVVGHDSGDIKRYNATSGAFLGTFASGLPAGPVDIELGPDNRTVFVTVDYGSTLRSYNLFSSAFLGSMNVPDSSVFSLEFGPDGKLYGADFRGDRILRINPSAGTTEDFVMPGSGGLDGPTGLTFDKGTMYVSSRINGEILRYDATNGQFEGVFSSPGGNGPQQSTFGPDGNLYVTHDDYQTVQRFDGRTGEFIDMFAYVTGITDGATPRFGTDGNLYVSSQFDGNIQRFDGKTGAPLGNIPVGSYGTQYPIGFVFVSSIPEPESFVMLSAGLGLLGFLTRRRKTA